MASTRKYNPVDSTKGPKSKLMLAQLLFSLNNAKTPYDKTQNKARMDLINRYLTEWHTRFPNDDWVSVWNAYFKHK